jgi:hypothetical protein
MPCSGKETDLFEKLEPRNEKGRTARIPLYRIRIERIKVPFFLVLGSRLSILSL